MTNNQEFLRPVEAAALLNIKLPTIRRKILLRQIGVVRLSARCVRIPKSEIDRLINAGTVPARDAA